MKNSFHIMVGFCILLILLSGCSAPVYNTVIKVQDAYIDSSSLTLDLCRLKSDNETSVMCKNCPKDYYMVCKMEDYIELGGKAYNVCKC